MAQFLGIHEGAAFIDDTKAKGGGEDAWKAYKAACEAHGCRPIHVHYNMDAGRAFCLTEASSAQEIKTAHADANLNLKEVIEVETAD